MPVGKEGLASHDAHCHALLINAAAPVAVALYGDEGYAGPVGYPFCIACVVAEVPDL